MWFGEGTNVVEEPAAVPPSFQSALQVEAAGFSESFILVYHTARCHILRDLFIILFISPLICFVICHIQMVLGSSGIWKIYSYFGFIFMI